jgi:heat shock protein HslJ
MISRIALSALLITSTLCQAEVSQIQGQYRFGHEVNTFCSGDPERCYWLVDTDADIRQRLKQQVADLEPYAPVCLNLLAEVSDEKADGFGGDYDGSIRVQELLGRCDQDVNAWMLRIEDLQHRRWVLNSIDGLELADFARQLGFEDDAPLTKVPDLDFGEQGFVSGNTGCNQFQGQARVVDNSLILSQLAVTAMLCGGFAGELELQLQLLYRNPLAISFDDSSLILETSEKVLRYRLRDWVY